MEFNKLFKVFRLKTSKEKSAYVLDITEEEYSKHASALGKAISIVSKNVDNYMFNLELKYNEIMKFKENINSKYESIVTEKKENLEKGTAELKITSDFELKNAEDIIKLLNIDITKYKLSSYWNKQLPSGKWIISALIAKLPQQESGFLEFINQLSLTTLPKFDNNKIKPILSNNMESKNLAVLSLQDIHIGIGDMESNKNKIIDTVRYLIGKSYMSYKLNEIALIIGPDLIHMDTFQTTTTKFTKLESHYNPMDTYIGAFDIMSNVINILSQYTEKLSVIFIPGNHDRLSSFHLLHALNQSFSNYDNVNIDYSYAERKVLHYGNNFIGLEHGDVYSSNDPILYATEFPIEWGSTKYRYLYTGHTHGKKVARIMTEKDDNGFVIKTVPALAETDYWSYHNKYTCNVKGAVLQIHDFEKGAVAEFTHSL